MITIYDVENQINKLQESVQQTNGALSKVEEQFVESQEKLDSLINEKELNTKAIAVLTLVQDSTKTLITDMFENVVSQALQYIHQDNNYGFELDFDKKGNLPVLSFNMLTPDMKEPHDIMDTRGGGSIDTVSLALREVLLEISKTNGFLFLDEPFKHLDNDETELQGIKFIKEIQEKTQRQIIMITHKKSIVNSEQNVKWM